MEGLRDAVTNAHAEPRSNPETSRFLQFCTQQADHVIGSNDAGEFLAVVNDWEGQEVVLVEEFCYFLFVRSGMSRNEWFLCQSEQGSIRGGQNQLSEGHGPH